MNPTGFVITTSPRAGVRLSLDGQWGNRPFDTVPAAIDEVRRLGGEQAVMTIRMEAGRR